LPFLPVTGTRAAARASLSALDYSLGSTLYLGAALGGTISNRSQGFANNVLSAMFQRLFRQRDLPSDIPYITTDANKEISSRYIGQLKDAYAYRNASLMVMNRAVAYTTGGFLLPLAMNGLDANPSEYAKFWTERGAPFIVGGLALLHMIAFANQSFVNNMQPLVGASNSHPNAATNSGGALSHFVLPELMMIGFSFYMMALATGDSGWITTAVGMPAPSNSSAAG
jgi:hypothetical protein